MARVSYTILLGRFVGQDATVFSKPLLIAIHVRTTRAYVSRIYSATPRASTHHDFTIFQSRNAACERENLKSDKPSNSRPPDLSTNPENLGMEYLLNSCGQNNSHIVKSTVSCSSGLLEDRTNAAHGQDTASRQSWAASMRRMHLFTPHRTIVCILCKQSKLRRVTNSHDSHLKRPIALIMARRPPNPRPTTLSFPHAFTA